MLDKLLIINPKNCNGCKMCELACSFYHDRIFNPAAARIYIKKVEDKGVDVPIICRDCKNQVCKLACPSDAFYLSDLGILTIDEEKKADAALLDGCYVLETAGASDIVARIYAGDTAALRVLPLELIGA